MICAEKCLQSDHFMFSPTVSFHGIYFPVSSPALFAALVDVYGFYFLKQDANIGTLLRLVRTERARKFGTRVW